jgi:protein SCO1/2
LLSGLAEVIGKLGLDPAKDYSVLTISFDEKDKPEVASNKKKNYLTLLDKNFPHDSWRFFVGDERNIKRLTESVGFKFKKNGIDFDHPACLVAISPDGRIVRYLYGTTFLPSDVAMAIKEAKEGKTGPTISKVLKFCYSYDPSGRKYVFSITKFAGAVIIAFAVVFFLYLSLIKGRVKSKTS